MPASIRAAAVAAVFAFVLAARELWISLVPRGRP